MARHPRKRARSAITVTEYAELDRWAAGFARGSYNLLVVVGPPGTGKTRAFKDALAAVPHLWLDTQVTPIYVFIEVYRHLNQHVLIDDVDSLHTDRPGVRLLKSLCQTERVKALSWLTATPILEQEEVPQRYTTSSPVAILGNDWRTLNRNVAALEDRGHVLFFDPPPAEVHRRVSEGRWFEDREILAFIGEHLRRLESLSLRDYVKAGEMKADGRDWRAWLRRRWFDERTALVADLRDDPSFPNEEDRVRRFMALGAGSRATYFRRKQDLPPAANGAGLPPEPPAGG